ncbi:hypothetical protein NGA_0319500 [Nannochloropsis gaditana CCMP526]|uniref:uncharacterized protein n=1 Tax=Nannochloropsis gaditana (strain CCMP526) TaxID=1093141 RepID=UPI00029F747B|nr:hypothetical protein NGA_0319500 [Nannochloropsis gaditana CCMP526]EKU20166.1 hypothetical protein NGA_0319500 [Nannochloropsis gaditana CCMP526]|eukprot:XP_005856186.1 hypothetical protein NGA_0319500 [Nannochloropsis gaditana CCMP526]
MEDANMDMLPGTVEAFARASRHGRFAGDEGQEEGGDEEEETGNAFFRQKAIPAGLELEMALMREERQRDKELKESFPLRDRIRNTSIVDRRVWENHEIGVGRIGGL